MNPTRKPLIAGNWKMFHGGPSGVMLAGECAKIAAENDRVDLVIAPPYTALAACAAECHETPVAIAAQNVHAKDQGAFTGEVSASMLKDAGCTWVILGHSERRQHFGENDELVAEKLDAALRAGLKPIVCVGETLAQREAGKTLRGREAPGGRGPRRSSRAPCHPGRHRLRARVGHRHRQDRQPPGRRRGPRGHPRVARRPRSTARRAHADPLWRVGEGRQRRGPPRVPERRWRTGWWGELGRGLVRCYRPRGEASASGAENRP